MGIAVKPGIAARPVHTGPARSDDTAAGPSRNGNRGHRRDGPRGRQPAGVIGDVVSPSKNTFQSTSWKKRRARKGKRRNARHRPFDLGTASHTGRPAISLQLGYLPSGSFHRDSSGRRCRARGGLTSSCGRSAKGGARRRSRRTSPRYCSGNRRCCRRGQPPSTGCIRPIDSAQVRSVARGALVLGAKTIHIPSM